ncbi:hypothetical protein J6590_050110 [Homalodisca vitripennis]|nr:hypothetical protein J6590_050110 [Homalodisca vitripennis]
MSRNLPSSKVIKHRTVACASVMCDCDPRTCDLCSGLASCAVTTPGLDSKQVLDERGINTYKKGKKGKKRVQTYPKAAWSPVQALSLQRMQVPSTNHKYEDKNYTSHQHRLQWYIKLRKIQYRSSAAPCGLVSTGVRNPAIVRYAVACKQKGDTTVYCGVVVKGGYPGEADVQRYSQSGCGSSRCPGVRTPAPYSLQDHWNPRLQRAPLTDLRTGAFHDHALIQEPTFRCYLCTLSCSLISE